MQKVIYVNNYYYLIVTIVRKGKTNYLKTKEDRHKTAFLFVRWGNWGCGGASRLEYSTYTQLESISLIV